MTGTHVLWYSINKTTLASAFLKSTVQSTDSQKILFNDKLWNFLWGWSPGCYKYM